MPISFLPFTPFFRKFKRFLCKKEQFTCVNFRDDYFKLRQSANSSSCRKDSEFLRNSFITLFFYQLKTAISIPRRTAALFISKNCGFFPSFFTTAASSSSREKTPATAL